MLIINLYFFFLFVVLALQGKVGASLKDSSLFGKSLSDQIKSDISSSSLKIKVLPFPLMTQVVIIFNLSEHIRDMYSPFFFWLGITVPEILCFTVMALSMLLGAWMFIR